MPNKWTFADELRWQIIECDKKDPLEEVFYYAEQIIGKLSMLCPYCKEHDSGFYNCGIDDLPVDHSLAIEVAHEFFKNLFRISALFPLAEKSISKANQFPAEIDGKLYESYVHGVLVIANSIDESFRLRLSVNEKANVSEDYPIEEKHINEEWDSLSEIIFEATKSKNFSAMAMHRKKEALRAESLLPIEIDDVDLSKKRTSSKPRIYYSEVEMEVIVDGKHYPLDYEPFFVVRKLIDLNGLPISLGEIAKELGGKELRKDRLNLPDSIMKTIDSKTGTGAFLREEYRRKPH